MTEELNPLTEEEQGKLEAIFNAGAARVEVLDEYWVHGHDEGSSYCHECCEKKVAALLQADPDKDYCVDGGWGTEGDSTPFCETCGKRLSNSLTQYACEENVGHFTENGFAPTSDDDCYEMERVIGSHGWQCHEFENWSAYERENEREFCASLYALGRSILSKIEGDPSHE